ncbi:MAG TPA: dipeptidase [Flavisolibacter sp.]|nr:dipeptidase [Flavisolibacter sp.]
MRLFLFLFATSLLSCHSYKSFHQKAIVVDTHNDVLSTATMKGLNIENNLSGKTHSDIDRFKKGGVDVQIFSIFCNERFGKDTAYKYASREIDSLYAIVGRNPGKMMLVTNPVQLQQAINQKKLACMMGVEGGHMIEDNMANLESFYGRGVRYMTLTWNNSTSWATSALDETTKKDSLPHKGLTDFGKKVVRRMNELGMMIDVSHVGEQTFWDAMAITTKPVIASHSCAYSLCPIFRNLKDDQLKAIGKNGGVVHLNFYSGFLDSTHIRRATEFGKLHKPEIDSLAALNWPGYEIEEHMLARYPDMAAALQPPLSLLIDHIDYIVRLAGIDHVGLGSDFDGISSAPKELYDVTTMPLITKALLKRGYKKEDVKKILGENFLRVFAANTVH